MAGSGSPDQKLTDTGDALRIGIVAALWHDTVMNGLLDGARRAVSDAGGTAVELRVPGSFELPIGAQALAANCDVVAALGVVIRGSTPHFDYVCDAATAGLTRVALDERTPIGFGVLTCDDEQQALDRAGLEGSTEDKGYEAVAAAVETLRALR